MAAQGLAALATAAMGLARAPWLIAVLAALLGFTSNAARPAIQAVMADVVPTADRVRAYSLNYWAINIGFAVSAAAAGFIAAHGYLLLFLGDAATTLLCALVVFLRIPETRPALPARPTAAPDNAADTASAVGMGTVLRDAAFMGLVGLTFLIAMVDGLGGTALPIEMGRNGFDAEAYGLVISLNGLLIVLAQIPLTRLTERRSRLLVLVTAALLDGVGFWLTDFAATLWFYALTVVVWTAGEMLRTPANMALVAELSPTHARGRYQGVYSLAWQGASFLAPLAAGAMLTGWGGSSVWSACLVLGLLCSAGYVRLLRGHRQTPEQASGLPAEQASGQAPVNADDPVGAAS
ncbi:MFS transporter [Streptacidiphilus monticola]